MHAHIRNRAIIQCLTPSLLLESDRLQPKCEQYESKKYDCRVGNLLKGQIFNIDQLFNCIYGELAGIDPIRFTLRFEISFQIGQGTDSSGQLHDDHGDQGDQMKNPPLWEIKIQEYRKSQDDKGNPQEMDEDH